MPRKRKPSPELQHSDNMILCACQAVIEEIAKRYPNGSTLALASRCIGEHVGPMALAPDAFPPPAPRTRGRKKAPEPQPDTFSLGVAAMQELCKD